MSAVSKRLRGGRFHTAILIPSFPLFSSHAMHEATGVGFGPLHAIRPHHALTPPFNWLHLPDSPLCL